MQILTNNNPKNQGIKNHRIIRLSIVEVHSNMEEKSISIFLLSGERGKWSIWSGKFSARSGELD